MKGKPSAIEDKGSKVASRSVRPRMLFSCYFSANRGLYPVVRVFGQVSVKKDAMTLDLLCFYRYVLK
jgi:hypothetical protein